MESNNYDSKNKFIVKYGVFSILFIMVIGMVWIAEYYEIQVKQPMHLVVSEDRCKVYINRQSNLILHKDDTLSVSQTLYGNLHFIVDSTYNEATFSVFLVHPREENNFQERTQGDTYIEGYMILGREKVREVFLRKVKL
ncbi:hypothetical protein [Prevotella histicola]|uniref:hypothetical protein n=1 Tax=Prevotella histicola TaxID=470565 RepID=UPI002430BA04|nr:hypothetical protein [Prevotella histicola]